MLLAAFIILGTAALLGSVLVVLHLRAAEAGRPPWPLAGLHGLLAIGGFGCLLLALRGPPRGQDAGATSFGMIAAAMIALAALVGGGMLAARLFKWRLAGTFIGIHATLAVCGYVILAAYLLAGG